MWQECLRQLVMSVLFWVSSQTGFGQYLCFQTYLIAKTYPSPKTTSWGEGSAWGYTWGVMDVEPSHVPDKDRSSTRVEQSVDQMTGDGGSREVGGVDPDQPRRLQGKALPIRQTQHQKLKIRATRWNGDYQHPCLLLYKLPLWICACANHKHTSRQIHKPKQMSTGAHTCTYVLNHTQGERGEREKGRKGGMKEGRETAR